ncbi:MAG: hypothetical protein JSS39_09470 [Nitrospira sp.]|nr:hypothetical protein [Nitrospira sp.]
MRTFMIACGWMMVFFAGCVPVTDGFRQDLPAKDAPTIVWGDDVSAVGMATTWLQKRGLSVLERSLLYANLETDNPELMHTLKDEATILQTAKKMGVQEVVFINRGGDARAPMISVRGVEVQTGRVSWSGSARYATFESRPTKDALALLTCEALATVWGFRPAGTKWFLSSEKMCSVDGALPAVSR